MGQLYTSGDWKVKPGKAEEFVAAWEELALWTTENVPTSTWAALLKDDDDPNRFRSFGPWESREDVAAWRAMAEFKEAIARMRELLESFEAHIFEAVVEVG